MIIKDWDRWQTFRKDRGTPSWIKVYRNLFTNIEWVSLSDSEKGQLVSIWILAADKNGIIPDDANVIQRMAMLDTKPNIKKFIDLGFMVTNCQPTGNHVVTVSPKVVAQSREEESREEESREEGGSAVASPKTGSRLPSDWQPSADDLTFCMKERADLDPQTTADSFRDYWIAQPGARGRKIDWSATWRNWVRKEKKQNRPRDVYEHNAQTLRELIGNA